MKLAMWLVLMVFAVIGGSIMAFVLLLTPAEAGSSSCGSSVPAVHVDVATLPTAPVAGYGGDQLENAALIMNAAQALGLDGKAQRIGVMTAMGESALKVVDHGDGAGPDSRGLFQQRDNGAWGSYADRMDPTISATNFFKALMAVENWQSLEPTIAAHRVQRNSDPNHYAQWWDRAGEVVNALSGTQVTAGASSNGCAPPPSPASGPTGPAPAGGGWTKPANGPVTSSFGMRNGRPHKGTDIGAPCSTPIVAASGGVVSVAGPASGYGHLITVDHSDGVVTAYAHMFAPDVLVHAGQQVTAGMQIGRVGNDGDSAGCHLHFEVRANGAPTDPQPFMAARGATL